MGAGGRSGQGAEEGPARLHPGRREAEGPLAPRSHGRAPWREAGELAADQGQRRRRPHRGGPGHPPGSARLGHLRPHRRGHCHRQAGRAGRAGPEARASEVRAQGPGHTGARTLSRLRSPRPRHAPPEGTAGGGLGERDQVRRLPPAGAAPRRQGEAADPQRAGLDRPLRAGGRRRPRRYPRPGRILSSVAG